MDINETKEGPIAIIELVGSVDTRSAFDFEKKALDLLAEDSRLFIVDFTDVDQLTSSGIRVLLMLGQKLGSVGGGLALCRLSDHVQTVIEISGLSGHLDILATREEAIAHLVSVDESQQGRASKVASLAARLLGRPGDSEPPQRRPNDTPPGLSRLSQEVAQLLGIEHGDDGRGAEAGTGDHRDH